MVKNMDRVDRFARKVMSNPVAKAIAGVAQVEALVEHFDTPILVAKEGYAADFNYQNAFPPHIRRFVILRVSNEGSKSATECWASITIEELNLNDIPLHWADCSYEVYRNSMDTITIQPGVTRDLDVAFSVYGSFIPIVDNVKQSGEIVKSTRTIADHRYSVDTMKGTMDVRLIPTGSKLIEDQQFGLSDTTFRLNSEKHGAWLASHLVLARPEERSEHYLSGDEVSIRYNSIIKITCSEGVIIEVPIVILVTNEPSGLNFDSRGLPRGIP